MSVAQALAAEFDYEAKTTRKLLERLPPDRHDWRPHGRSMTLGRLAHHVVEILSRYGEPTLGAEELDFAPPGSAPHKAPEPPPADKLMQEFDAAARSLHEKLARVTPDDLVQPWTLKFGGEPRWTQPRGAVWRSFVMNHLIHHRGQLSVYLRLLDVPLPAMYGPSADEGR
jgi:uncharacterized damage-inducible protein DinB